MQDIACFVPASDSKGAGQALLASSLPFFFSFKDSKAAKQHCRRTGALVHVASCELDDGDLLALAKAGGAVVFSLSDVIESQGFNRAILISKMRLLLTSCRKTGAGMAFATLAASEGNMRTARELVAFARVLGATDSEIKAAEERLEKVGK
jgi:RNase P/RNase MRP subunit p30